MEFTGDLIVGTKKSKIPILYLDTCIMLELAKYAKGICDNSHKAEIGELFCLLPKLMQSGKLMELLHPALEMPYGKCYDGSDYCLTIQCRGNNKCPD